ncbi:MAG TPA: hypothetical protein VJU18_06470 [Vicinamibacteria bacterium]|nr:hypothetical protein [Vicinamibacteria bacterium]
MPVVDIHCHVFTGKDIPLLGFLRNNHVPEVLAKLVDRVVQGGEPDEALAAAAVGIDEEPPDEAIDDIIRRVRQADAEIDALIERELLDLADQAGLSPLDWFGAAHRYVRWALLLRKDLPAITEKMTDTHDSDGVALYTPAMMDMENWLDDTPKTKFETQVKAMRQLTIDQRGLVHPLIAFDPKRQLDAGASLTIVKDGILEGGFVGVKVYPPMGYQPIGNGEFTGGSATWDASMAALFKFY